MSPDSNISVEDDLKDLLKRCPPGTFEAAVAFRKNKDASYVEKIVMGIIDRHLEPDQREILANSDDMLRMYEDLGMDSLTMLEIVMLVEQTLEVSIDNEELRDLRTVGDGFALSVCIPVSIDLTGVCSTVWSTSKSGKMATQNSWYLMMSESS